jgi:hypothetical protein
MHYVVHDTISFQNAGPYNIKKALLTIATEWSPRDSFGTVTRLLVGRLTNCFSIADGVK